MIRWWRFLEMSSSRHAAWSGHCLSNCNFEPCYGRCWVKSPCPAARSHQHKPASTRSRKKSKLPRRPDKTHIWYTTPKKSLSSLVMHDLVKTTYVPKMPPWCLTRRKFTITMAAGSRRGSPNSQATRLIRWPSGQAIKTLESLFNYHLLQNRK